MNSRTDRIEPDSAMRVAFAEDQDGAHIAAVCAETRATYGWLPTTIRSNHPRPRAPSRRVAGATDGTGVTGHQDQGVITPDRGILAA